MSPKKEKNCKKDQDIDIKQFLVQMEIEVFEIPPYKDVIVICNKAPIGKNAVKRMLDSCSPGQFEMIEPEHPLIEALVVNTVLINLMGRDRLVEAIIAEVDNRIDDRCMLHIKLNVKLISRRIIEVSHGDAE